MQKPENTSKHSTPHPMQQYGKGINVVGGPSKVKVIIGDEERLVDQYKIVATWLNPKDPNKPTYAFPLSVIVRTLEKNGVFPNTALEAIRIKTKSIYKKCRELKIYDNRPNNPFTLLAWYQEGNWLPVEHPEAKKLMNEKPKTYAT